VQRRRRRRRVSPVRSGKRLSFGAGPAQAGAVATGSDEGKVEKTKKTHRSACGKPGKKSNFYSLGDPAEQTVRHSTQCVHVGRVAPTTPPTEHRTNIKTSSRAHATRARATVPSRLQWCQRFIIVTDAVNRRTTRHINIITYLLCVLYIIQNMCLYALRRQKSK